MKLFAYDDRKQWGRHLCSRFSLLGHEAKLFSSAKEVQGGKDTICFIHVQHQPLELRAQIKEMMEELSQKELFLIPNIKEIRLFDDKVKQSQTFSNWMPKTWHIENFEAALNKADELSYPIVSKAAEGASASNVRFVKNKEAAIREAYMVFKGEGIPLYLQGHCQKGYLLWQEYLPQADKNDWRVILVAKKYAVVNERFIKDENQPFASGSGKRKMLTHIDFEVLQLLETTYRFATEFDLSMACVDIVYDSHRNPIILEDSCAWGMYAYPECGWFERAGSFWQPTTYIGNDMFELITQAILKGEFN